MTARIGRWLSVLGGILRASPLEISALVGVVLMGVGVGMHDVGFGLAVSGATLVGLAVFSAHNLKGA